MWGGGGGVGGGWVWRGGVGGGGGGLLGGGGGGWGGGVGGGGGASPPKSETTKRQTPTPEEEKEEEEPLSGPKKEAKHTGSPWDTEEKGAHGCNLVDGKKEKMRIQFGTQKRSAISPRGREEAIGIASSEKGAGTLLEGSWSRAFFGKKRHAKGKKGGRGGRYLKCKEGVLLE